MTPDLYPLSLKNTGAQISPPPKVPHQVVNVMYIFIFEAFHDHHLLYKNKIGPNFERTVRISEDFSFHGDW